MIGLMLPPPDNEIRRFVAVRLAGEEEAVVLAEPRTTVGPALATASRYTEGVVAIDPKGLPPLKEGDRLRVQQRPAMRPLVLGVAR